MSLRHIKAWLILSPKKGIGILGSRTSHLTGQKQEIAGVDGHICDVSGGA